jgi:hypothetical protein
VFRKGFLAAAVFCVCFAVPVVLAGKEQRPILNFAPRVKLRPQGRSCLPGVNFVPWGLSYPLGLKFSVRPSIRLNSRECSPLGVNKGVNIPPYGTNFTHGGQVHP